MKLIFLLLGIFLISMVSAVQLPHAFYGYINYSNGEGVAGTITAKINGVSVGSSVLSDGFYDLVVESNGGTVYFYLEDKLLGNYIFDAFEITELNFIIEISEQEEQNQTQPTTSRGSHSHKKFQIEFCETNWECSGWGECKGGLMTRQCYDGNYCDYGYNKPVEETGCDIFSKLLVKKEKSFNLVLFGAVSTLFLMGFLIFLLTKQNTK